MGSGIMNGGGRLVVRALRAFSLLATAMMLMALFATISLFPSARAAQDFGRSPAGTSTMGRGF